MEHKQTFQQVLNNCDDQVSVREILGSVLTREQKEEVVGLYNERVDKGNAIRAELDAIHQLTRDNYHD